MSEKEKHIEWMDEQDAALTREAKQHDFAGEVELEEVFMEDFGWAGDTCWTGEWSPKSLNPKGLRLGLGGARNLLILNDLRIKKKVKKSEKSACVFLRLCYTVSSYERYKHYLWRGFWVQHWDGFLHLLRMRWAAPHWSQRGWRMAQPWKLYVLGVRISAWLLE